LDNGADTKVTDLGDGSTLLHIAINSNAPDAIILKLIEYNAPLNQPDKTGMTPLDLAIQQDDEGLIKLLQDKGADIDTPDHLGQTALMRAAQKGDNELVETLLRYGANINAQDDAGLTAFMHAIINNHSRLIQIFLARNDIDLTLTDNKGNTVIKIAQNYSPEKLAKLIETEVKKKQHRYYSGMLQEK